MTKAERTMGLHPSPTLPLIPTPSLLLSPPWSIYLQVYLCLSLSLFRSPAPPALSYSHSSGCFQQSTQHKVTVGLVRQTTRIVQHAFQVFQRCLTPHGQNMIVLIARNILEQFHSFQYAPHLFFGTRPDLWMERHKDGQDWCDCPCFMEMCVVDVVVVVVVGFVVSVCQLRCCLKPFVKCWN